MQIVVRSATACLLLFATAAAMSACEEAPRITNRPNIIVILTDDQDVRTLDFMPFVSELAQNSLNFRNFFVNVALCCPSRASILRGQYHFNHGCNQGVCAEYFRETGLDRDTMATRFHHVGYETALIGKYLNHYAGDEKNHIPPGWDEWAGWVSNTIDPLDFEINHNGEFEHHTKYKTDFFNQLALDFIATAKKPFFLYLAPTSPHRPYIPAARHAGLFASEPFDPSPSFDESDVSDKPPAIQALPPLSAPEITTIGDTYRTMLEMLLSVDEMVEQVLTAAEAKGDTVLFYLSDNGVFRGEHRIPDRKGHPYEEAIRVPAFLYSGGALVGARDDLALNIDVMPTLLTAAGLNVPSYVDGRQLWTPAQRQSFVIEGNNSTFTGFRTATRKYVRYPAFQEHYDLSADHYELQNDWPSLGSADHTALDSHLDLLLTCKGKTCREYEDLPPPQ